MKKVSTFLGCWRKRCLTKCFKIQTISKSGKQSGKRFAVLSIVCTSRWGQRVKCSNLTSSLKCIIEVNFILLTLLYNNKLLENK